MEQDFSVNWCVLSGFRDVCSVQDETDCVYMFIHLVFLEKMNYKMSTVWMEEYGMPFNLKVILGERILAVKQWDLI